MHKHDPASKPNNVPSFLTVNFNIYDLSWGGHSNLAVHGVSNILLILYIIISLAGLREVYRRPTYGLPLSDVYSLSEKYRRYKQPQYYQL